MKDNECVQFLQWALPHMQMRWPGFRKVRKRVCKRIDRRMRQLNIDSMDDYRAFLKSTPSEWQTLKALCPITISRFYRDKAVFECLQRVLMPQLLERAQRDNKKCVKVWSIGCASGEEPYTLALIWLLQLQSAFPGIDIKILATDLDASLRQRISQACYPYSSIRGLPKPWQQQAFTRQQDLYCLKSEYKQLVHFIEQDIRYQVPDEQFDLVLCRNLVFTYFSAELQLQMLNQINKAMQPHAALVIGCHERLPQGAEGFETWSEQQRIFTKS